MPGFVVAGTHSGCGKTTITLGLLAAFREKGLAVQSFKAGPDFIDAGLHGIITRRPSRNLDLWMCGPDYVRSCYGRHSSTAEISVVEGVMGLYDGNPSTADLASTLGIPVVLVVDAFGMAESAGALVKGFSEYGAGLDNNSHGLSCNFLGIIFNRVASERHFLRLAASIRDIPVIGYLPRDGGFEIPHRHLGLATAAEEPLDAGSLAQLAGAVLRHVDVERIVASLGVSEGRGNSTQEAAMPLFGTSDMTVAVARDRAFCFYYEDNLDLLRQAGAGIVEFSPLRDSGIPENADALYLGGGYPELYAGALSENRGMRESVREWVESGRHLYAECGGLMYLSRGIHDMEGRFFPMASVMPFETEMKKKRSRLGYREVRLAEDCVLGPEGAFLRGHEFHYSEIRDVPGKEDREGGARNIFLVRDNRGGDVACEGFRFRNTLASYVHLHFGSNPACAGNFINFVKGVEQ